MQADTNQKKTYQNIENAPNGTTTNNYKSIAKALEVPVSFLMKDIVKNTDRLFKYEKEQAITTMNFKEKKVLGNMMNEICEVIVKYMKKL